MFRALAFAFCLSAPAFGQLSAPQWLATPILDARSVDAADLDGDGQLELLIASASDGRIGWVAGLGTGHFGRFEVLTDVAPGANFVRAADLDLDGDLDVIGGSAADGSVRVWENLGGVPVHFGPTVLVTSAVPGLSDLDLVDVNGDGALDLLTASSTNDRIGVALGLGDATFGPLIALAGANLGASGVAALDVDGDGLLDVVGAHAVGQNINYFPNLGAGQFGPAVNLVPTAGMLSDVEAADFDLDGDLDLVSSGAALRLHENLGAGSFAAPVTLHASTSGRVRSDDFDGDGDVDLVVGVQAASSGRLLRNDGGLQFGQAAFFFMAGATYDFAWGDLNGDGEQDFVSAAIDRDEPQVLIGFGPGISNGFALEVAPFAGDNGAFQVCFGDLDGDGWEDLAVGAGLTNTVKTYRSLGDGSYAAPVLALANVGALGRIAIADFNGDGLGDVMGMTTQFPRLMLALNDGMGGFLPPFIAYELQGMVDFATGDMDNDGDIDAVVAWAASNTVRWVRNDGTGMLAQSTSFNFDHPGGLQVVDFNRDGWNDVAVVRTQGAGFWVRLGPHFSSTSPGAGAVPHSAAGGVAFGELDNDGAMDMVFAGPDAAVHSAVDVHYHGSGALLGIDSGLSDCSGILLLDVDNDGILDVVVSSAAEGRVHLMRGLGGYAFAAPEVLVQGVADIAGIASGDLDGDGDADLAFTSSGSDVTGVIVNQGALLDCNGNLVPDFQDIQAATSTDFDMNGVPDECVAPPLYADVFALDVHAGGVQVLQLDAGPAHAGEIYVLSGSLSGPTPGLELAGLHIPINYDGYTTLALTPGASPLAPPIGVLDANGRATVLMTVALPSHFADKYQGKLVRHAFVTFGSDFNFASNGVPLWLE